jgi:predicted ATP-dependent serine protease
LTVRSRRAGRKARSRRLAVGRSKAICPRLDHAARWQGHHRADSVISTDHQPRLALGVGGLPRSRVIEIFGPESSGKTTLMLQTIAQAQKRGGVAAFIDAEHALDAARRSWRGLDNLLVSQPTTANELDSPKC